MARRILNRKDLRADYDAAERRNKQDEDEDEEDEPEDDEDEEEEAAEEEGETEVEEEPDEEAAPKKRKPAKEPKPKKPRVRASKVIRMKVVWGVFNNSNQRVAVYDYPKRKDAEEHAARLTAEKKSTHFVQPLKEPIEEKKEAKEA